MGPLSIDGSMAQAEQASLAPSYYPRCTLEDTGRFLCTTRRRTPLVIDLISIQLLSIFSLLLRVLCGIAPRLPLGPAFDLPWLISPSLTAKPTRPGVVSTKQHATGVVRALHGHCASSFVLDNARSARISRRSTPHTPHEHEHDRRRPSTSRLWRNRARN